jgi:hypothetical protein
MSLNTILTQNKPLILPAFKNATLFSRNSPYHSPNSLPMDSLDFFQKRTISPKFGLLTQKVARDVVQNGVCKELAFVPTPQNLVERMVKEADLKPGMHILEPSAGQGHIIDVLTKMNVDTIIDAIEPNPTLRAELSRKNCQLKKERDILHYWPKKTYQRIIMNPPYGNGLDILHTLHCFKLLRPGGILVAVLPEKAFGASKMPGWERWINPNTSNEYVDDLKALAKHPETEYFRTEKLPKGSFQNSDIPDSVDTRLLIIKKSNKLFSERFKVPEKETSSDFSSDKKPRHVFYSGGDEALDLFKTYRKYKQARGKNTNILTKMPDGEDIEEKVKALKAAGKANEEMDEMFLELSALAAKAATGKVRVFIYEPKYRHLKSVYKIVEEPGLLANDKVTAIKTYVVGSNGEILDKYIHSGVQRGSGILSL